MPAYAGPLHSLVELHCLSDLRESPVEQSTMTDGLSGRRRGRLTPLVRRQWSCAIGVASPSDLGVLEEMYYAHRGRAVWLVTESARVQNLLPPPLSLLDRAHAVMAPVGWVGAAQTLAGAVPTADGMAAASYLVDGSGAVKSPVVPVVAGLPVTVSAYVAGGGTVALVWVDSAGAETTAVTSAAAPAGSVLQRVSVSLPAAPEGATACRLFIAGAEVYARPQITWTASPVPWVRGKGAPAVLLGPVDESAIMALTDGSRNLSSFTYTISEVG